MDALDPWYLQTVVCPIDKTPLALDGQFLVSPAGNRYPIVEGIPVLLPKNVELTIDVARTSAEAAFDLASGRESRHKLPYVETLGISPAEKETVQRLFDEGAGYDAVVSGIIGATSGIAYKNLIGTSQDQYPIPDFRFPNLRPGRLLDVGCNWGRWTIAGANRGFDATGIDPQLGAVLAAKRIAAKLATPAHFLVADARYLPFQDGYFDYVWSYSVLQHFSEQNLSLTLDELRRATGSGATIRLQLANILGLRSLYNISKHGFKSPKGFEVRYRAPWTLKRALTRTFGDTNISADCFFGLGLQWSDFRWVSKAGKVALLLSESMRRASQLIPALAWMADSIFCTSVRG